MRKHHQSFNPQRATPKAAWQALPETVTHRMDVAQHLRGRVADVRGIWRAGSTNPRATPRAVWLAHDRAGHGLGLEQEHTRRPDHQVIDVTRATRQRQAVDQDVVLG